MPLDPRIPLGVQPLQIQSPFEAMGQLAQLQQVREQTEARRLAAEEARTKHLVQQKVGAAYRNAASIDPKTGRLTLNRQVLLQDVPDELIPGMLKQFDEDEESFYKLQTARSAWDTARQKQLGSMARTIVAARGAPSVPGLWATYLSGAKSAGLLDEEQYAQYSAITDPEQIHAVASAVAGVEPSELKQVTTVDEQGRKVTKFVTPTEGATYVAPTDVTEDKPETRSVAVQAAEALLAGDMDRYQALVRVSREVNPPMITPSYQWAVPPGAPPTAPPVLMTTTEIAASGAQRPATETTRAPTEAERKAAGFHTQMQQALANINRLEANLTAADLYQIQSLPQEGFMGALNRSAMSDAAKQYIQAFNQFTEARLRPVSGAAIADTEYARDRATYGKQYAETPELAAQRQAARASALEALRVMGGTAIEGPPADDRVTTAVAAALRNVGAGRHTLSDGTVWDKQPNGSIVKVR